MGLFGLFSKKDPCPICGATDLGLFPVKIEGTPICKACSEKLDVPDQTRKTMTIDALKSYMAFYEQNQALRAKFQVTETVDFGMLNAKPTFDFDHKLFCMSKKLDKTIFEGAQIKGFTIKEDMRTIFQYKNGELIETPSTVPQTVTMMSPMIEMIRMQNLTRDDDDYADTPDLSEPFEKFYVEIQVDHPYWSNLSIEKSGPEFNDHMPSGSDYMRDYYNVYELMQRTANCLQAICEG